MLYIVATPIGNLDDLSIRQAKTLASSDIILAEDTRSAKILLNACIKNFKFQISNFKLISYYKEKEFEKLPEILELLRQGKNISLISESGTPLISDPGYLLVKACIKERLLFTVIPGPSAITTALVYSGFEVFSKNGGVMFLGFFPKKQAQLFQLINRLKQIKNILPEIVFVFYESPMRINETLQCFKTLKWDVKIVICREMTKKFEEIIRGPVDELIKRNYKGELTVVIQ
jgi:16S rRNA (cytidine1402-2'-O)-methyltransferase